MSVGTAVVFRVTIWNGDSNPDFAMAHKVLQCLCVHSRFSHIAAIGVAADVRRYAWHLQAVNLVVPIHHML